MAGKNRVKRTLHKSVKLLKFGLEELKFLRSLKDLKIFYSQKLPFIMPKFTDNAVKDTEIPPSLQIEPTNHCNLSCICCSREKMKRDKGYMDLDLFRKIIDEASGIGVKRVHLYLHGEPLLHPRVVEMIKHLKTKGLGITIATNGMLLDRKKSELMLLSGMDSADYLTFSILGYSKEVHEKIMRGASHYQVVKNLLDFLELRRNHRINGPIIETVFYEMRENEHEKDQFNKRWQGVVDHVRINGRISEQFSSRYDKKTSISIRNKACRNLWQRMTVFWNGDVTLCIADLDGLYSLGNLREKSIHEIWNTRALQAIRQLHKDGKFSDLPLCAHCDW